MATKNPKKPPPPPPPLGDRAGTKPLLNAYRIELDRIIPDPDQPRAEFDGESIERLADSFVTRGQLLPVRVRWSKAADRYVIIDGERRYRAALRTNIKHLECVIEGGPREPDRSELLIDQLAANCQREDLTPMEQARAFRRLMDARGWSQTRLASELRIPQPSISRALALLTLPERVQGSIEAGLIPPATGYEVSKLADPAEQLAVAGRIVEGKLSRSEAAAEVRQSAARSKPAPSDPARPYEPERRVLGHWSGVTILAEADRGAIALADLVRALGAALALAEFERVKDGGRRA